MTMRGDGRVFQRGKKLWIAYYVRGKEHREPGGATMADARRLLRTRQAEIHGGRFIGARAERVTVGEVLRAYVENRRLADSKSLPTIISVTKQISGHIGHWRAMDTTLPRLERWSAELLAEEYARGTVKVWMAYVGAAFKVARRAGLITHTPDLPTITVNNTRQGFYSGEQFEALRRELPLIVGQVATFAFLTGWRKSEILGLRWDEVDRRGKVIRLRDEPLKHGQRKLLPLRGEVEALIETRWKARTVGASLCPWVFHRDGRRITGFDKSWKSACRRAGLEGRLLHDFRRTAVRDMVNAGVPDTVARKITGHKTRAVFDRYHIVTTDDQAAALDRTAEHRKASAGTVTAMNTDRTRTKRGGG